MTVDTVMVAPIDAPDDALLGYGINQVTGERIAVSCLQNIPDPTISIPSGNGDHMTTLIVQDSESYSELMSTVANISASGVSWSASASVSYLREQANSDTSITLTWTRIVRTQDREIDWTQAKVTPDALELLKTQGADAFLAKYGTHCIIGIAYGGSFSGYSQIKTQSVSEKQQLMTSISGSLSGFGVDGSVSASFEQDLQSSSVHFTSSQNTFVVGATPISFNGLDIAGMQSAIESFAPSANGPLPGVSGAPVALICLSWDQFTDIYNALDGNVSEIGLSAEEHALVSLSSEYSALSYVAGTAANLQNSPAIIPAYAPLLTRIGNEADAACNTISQLGIPDIRAYASSGTGSYVISASLKPQVDRIAAGYGEVQVSYALDGMFNNGASEGIQNSFTNLTLPGGGEHNLGGFVHYRAEGNDEGDQILTLLYTFDRDANGIPFIAARMHYQDPYAPPETQQQDLSVVQQYLNQTTTLSCTAAWPAYPWNEITVTLIPPTG